MYALCHVHDFMYALCHVHDLSMSSQIKAWHASNVATLFQTRLLAVKVRRVSQAKTPSHQRLCFIMLSRKQQAIKRNGLIALYFSMYTYMYTSSIFCHFHDLSMSLWGQGKTCAACKKKKKIVWDMADI